MMKMLLALQATVTALGQKIGGTASQQPEEPEDREQGRTDERTTGTRTTGTRPQKGQDNRSGAAGAGRLHPEQPSRQGPKRDTTQGPEGQVDQSTNEDFHKVCKASFRYVQLAHHSSNWQSLPKGIATALSRVVGNICPPMPTTEFKNELAALATEFSDKICRTVEKHLTATKVATEQELIKLNDKDVLKAGLVVEKQLNHRLGKKMTESRRNSLLNEAIGMVGMAKKATSGANRPAQIPSGTEPRSPRRTRSGKQLFSEAVAGTPKTKRPDTHTDSPRSLPDMDTRGDIEGDEGQPHRQCSQPCPKVFKGPINRTHSKTDSDKLHFDVKKGVRVLIIGDSEVQNLSNLPNAFQVESFRGARFPWLTDVVKELELPDSVEHIILSAGINHRDQDFQKVVVPQFDTCVDALLHTGRKIHFLGVDVPISFTEEQDSVMTELNHRAHRKLKLYIPPEVDRVTTIADGLHYDERTLSDITDRILSHFDNLN
jgi:hypothetical protein